MNKLIVPAITATVGLAAAAAWSQVPAGNPGLKFFDTQLTNTNSGSGVKIYYTTSLESDAARTVQLTSLTVPPKGGTQFHRHPGDQWETVLEGEMTFTIKGQAPRTLKVGDSVYIPRGTVHRNQNLT